MDMNDRSSSAFGRVVWRAAGDGHERPLIIRLRESGVEGRG